MRFIEPSYEIMQCPDGEQVLRLLELAARTCYKSEDAITEGSFHSAHKLIRKILKSGHHSVIEHACVTVRFVCNRGVSHELVRHRIAAYSQESTRYCNYSKDKHGGGLNIIEPSYRPPQLDCPAKRHTIMGQFPGDPACICLRRLAWEEALRKIEWTYLRLLELGEKPQEARDILPIGLKTEVVTTYNLRQWRHVFGLRALNKRAHPQIRELMIPLLRELAERIPIIFDDLVEQLAIQSGSASAPSVAPSNPETS